MWKFRKQTADSKQQAAKVVCRQSKRVERRRSGSGRLLFVVCCVLLTASCRYDMQNQPKMKPYRSSDFFSDGLGSRPLVEGTVPRGFLKTDTEYFTGKKAGKVTGATPTVVPAGPQPSAASGTPPTGAAAYPDDVEVFPVPVTAELVHRGKERYEIYCSACHGFTGNGDGMIVRRGFRRAAAFNDERLRQAPVGHFFDAMTNGWGVMPSYAAQIPVQDRWAIISYIRALQLKYEAQQPPSTGQQPAAPIATPEGGRQP